MFADGFTLTLALSFLIWFSIACLLGLGYFLSNLWGSLAISLWDYCFSTSFCGISSYLLACISLLIVFWSMLMFTGRFQRKVFLPVPSLSKYFATSSEFESKGGGDYSRKRWLDFLTITELPPIIIDLSSAFPKEGIFMLWFIIPLLVTPAEPNENYCLL